MPQRIAFPIERSSSGVTWKLKYSGVPFAVRTSSQPDPRIIVRFAAHKIMVREKWKKFHELIGVGRGAPFLITRNLRKVSRFRGQPYAAPTKPH